MSSWKSQPQMGKQPVSGQAEPLWGLGKFLSFPRFWASSQLREHKGHISHDSHQSFSEAKTLALAAAMPTTCLSTPSPVKAPSYALWFPQHPSPPDRLGPYLSMVVLFLIQCTFIKNKMDKQKNKYKRTTLCQALR